MTSEITPRTDALLSPAWKTSVPPLSERYAIMSQHARQLERELAALRRGEFICQRCSLRKDSEHDTKHEF